MDGKVHNLQMKKHVRWNCEVPDVNLRLLEEIIKSIFL